MRPREKEWRSARAKNPQQVLVGFLEIQEKGMWHMPPCIDQRKIGKTQWSGCDYVRLIEIFTSGRPVEKIPN